MISPNLRAAGCTNSIPEFFSHYFLHSQSNKLPTNSNVKEKVSPAMQKTFKSLVAKSRFPLINFCRETPVHAPEGRPASSRGQAARSWRRAASGWEITKQEALKGRQKSLPNNGLPPLPGLDSLVFGGPGLRSGAFPAPSLARGYSLWPLRGQDQDAAAPCISRQVLTSCFLMLSLLASGATLFGQNPVAETCTVQTVTWNGWKTVQMANSWVTLSIVPQLGGRLMQVTFDGYDYLWVNEQLKGQYFAPEVSAEQRRWFNYGGDKIWPMPEGSEDEQHWAGAAGQVLDCGEFRYEILSQGARCSVRLTGPPDPQIGQQYIRDISIGADSPEILFHAVMKNTSGYPQEWSEQSVSQYNLTDPQDPAKFNTEYWAFAPAHSQSAYLNSYYVRTGQANNPTYSVRDAMFTLHYLGLGGEVWVDSPGEYVAVVDGQKRYAMVERFHYDRNAEYPGKGTVIFFTSGPPTVPRPGAGGGPRPETGTQQGTRPSVYYMEAELNSPMIRLAPGETYAMDTQWYPTRMGSNFKAATYAGVVGQPLTAAKTADGLALAGEFGVFYAGKLEARFYGRGGMRIGTAPVMDVTPTKLVTLQQTVKSPSETMRVSLHLVDAKGLDRGPLGEVMVPEAGN